MNEKPSDKEIMIKFGLLIETVMKNTKSTKDLLAFSYAINLVFDAISEEICERNKNE
jgi:hypothetical protein